MLYRSKRCADVSLNRKKSAEVMVPGVFSEKTERLQIFLKYGRRGVVMRAENHTEVVVCVRCMRIGWKPKVVGKFKIRLYMKNLFAYNKSAN